MGPVAHATGRDISLSGLHYRETYVEQLVPRKRRGEEISKGCAGVRLGLRFSG